MQRLDAVEEDEGEAAPVPVVVLGFSVAPADFGEGGEEFLWLFVVGSHVQGMGYVRRYGG